ncbi:MAG: damage repair protein [Bacilli bacterium]|jgi:DNA polymerase V|nr:damage repair protein [Bacilli bacterium]
MLEQFKLHDNIICIDLKSFYASAECIAINKDPLKYDLVVADTSRGKGSIVLAVSPSLKAKGVPGRLRIFELPRNIKIHIAKPRMSYYIYLSNQILKMYLEYFASNDILIYSIDEVFIDATSYLKLYQKTTYELAQFLLAELYKRFKLLATCGIGPNLVLAKFAMDIEAKHSNDYIAEFNYDNIDTKLWPITDLKSCWGIGKGIEKRLHKLGIKSMYDLAHFDIYQLVDEFGILGEELFLHANGIDVSKIQEQPILNERKGYNISHTLYKNTPKYQVEPIIKDMILTQVERLRNDHKMCQVVALHIRFAHDENLSSFSKQHKLNKPTIDIKEITQAILSLFSEVEEAKIRKIGISLTNLKPFEQNQLDIFTYNKKNDTKLDYATDIVNTKFGENTIFKARVLQEDSQYFTRKKLIGGHNAK